MKDEVVFVNLSEPLWSHVDCGERDGFEIIDVAIGGVGRSAALSGCEILSEVCSLERLWRDRGAFAFCARKPSIAADKQSTAC